VVHKVTAKVWILLYNLLLCQCSSPAKHYTPGHNKHSCQHWLLHHSPVWIVWSAIVIKAAVLRHNHHLSYSDHCHLPYSLEVQEVQELECTLYYHHLHYVSLDPGGQVDLVVQWAQPQVDLFHLCLLSHLLPEIEQHMHNVTLAVSTEERRPNMTLLFSIPHTCYQNTVSSSAF
jgi:hypothetical protein